jgi:hypothetical protein
VTFCIVITEYEYNSKCRCYTPCLKNTIYNKERKLCICVESAVLPHAAIIELRRQIFKCSIWTAPCLPKNSASLFIHSFIPMAHAECDYSLSFTGASSIPVYNILFPVIILHHLFFHPPSLHLFLGPTLGLALLFFYKLYECCPTFLVIMYESV